MVQFETYQAPTLATSGIRKWLVGGLVVSLGLHATLLYMFYHHQMVGFGSPMERTAPPQPVNMRRVVIADPVAPDPKTTTVAEKPQGQAAITIPLDRPEVTEINIAPQIDNLPKTQLLPREKVEMASLDKLVPSDSTSRAVMDKELNNIAQALVKESPRNLNQPIIRAGSGSNSGGAGAGTDNVKIPGVDSIDEAIARTGGAMRAGDRAGMPGGALFEYDSYALRDEAVGQLRKLGFLIEKNPRATFSIEGHTDSFGSPEYNQRLSLARAESVKIWLVQNLGIDPMRIQTQGFGNTKALVAAEKSKEEQAPNRRVELVVRTNPVRR